jgi:catechol 2,3-dioxygenase-like lactoylglutathione lyase family enzyme
MSVMHPDTHTGMSSGTDAGFTVRKAGHVVVRVKDPERTARFFEDIVRDIRGFIRKGVVQRGMHFLTSDFADNHHMLLIRPAKPGATAQDADALVGMARVSFEIADPTGFERVVARLIEKGIRPEIDAGHGRKAVRFRDADGLPYEFWCRAGVGGAS